MEVNAVGQGEVAVLEGTAPPTSPARPGPPACGPAGRWFSRGGHLGLALRAATLITRGIPTPVRYRLADIGGTAAYWMLRDRAAVARGNYQVFAPGDPAATARLTSSAFRNYARTLLDFLVLERLVERLKATPETVDMAPLQRELDQGRAAVVVTPHLGNWDLGAAMIATCGRPVHAVADKFGPPAVDSLIRAVRERLGVRIIPTGPSSAREALRALRRGEVLLLAADIDRAGTGVAVSFLGRRVYLPAGPATLALRTGASLIPGYVRRLPGGRHEARMLDPIPLPAAGDAESRVRQLTQGIAEAFEKMIWMDPGQWFAFHRLVSADRTPEEGR